MLKIQLKGKSINSKIKRTAKFFYVVLKSEKKVITFGSFNRQIGILSIDLFKIILALKNGARLSNKFNNKWTKVNGNITTKRNVILKY